jgi:hypothetical protein
MIIGFSVAFQRLGASGGAPSIAALQFFERASAKTNSASDGT